MSEATIHVAHCINHKAGLKTYRAVAVVTNKGCRGYHTHRLAVDDSAEEAEARAIAYIRETFFNDGLEPPTSIERHGKRCNADINTVAFVSAT